MVRMLSILARRCRLFAALNRLMLLVLYLAFLTTLNSAKPQQHQQPRPSPSTSISNSPLTTPTTPTPKPVPPSATVPQQCNIELSTSWCPLNQSCFITSTTFQCAPITTTTPSGWTITPHLNIIFFKNPNDSTTLLLPSGGTCLLLPIPSQNSTHLDILILALKQHDVYYRTSTILISDDPVAILRGVSSCKNPQERCVEARCVPVLGYGEVCKGNDECYNPPRAFNSTTYYNPNLKDGMIRNDPPPPQQQQQQDNGNGNGGETLGRVCDYEPGKLDAPPKCIDYVRVHDRPDSDQHFIPPAEHKRKLNWIFAIVVLVVIIAFVLLFMCWRKTHGSRSVSGDDLPQQQQQQQQQMHHHQQQRFQSYKDDPDGEGDGKYKATTGYLSTNYLKGLSAAGGPESGPGQGKEDRRGSTSSQTSVQSNVSWANTRRMSVAEKMVMSRRDRDNALDHEFMNRLSQSRPSGTFHRIEQLATSHGHGIAVGGGGGGDGRVGPMSMGPSCWSMSIDPMQVYLATAPSSVASDGGSGGGGGGRGRVHELQRQEPSPPPNTPESQQPGTMPVV